MSYEEIVDPNARYHYSTWGNGPNRGTLVADSLELCDDADCPQPHVQVLAVEE